MEIDKSDPVVYLEHHTSTLFLEQPATIAAYHAITNAITATTHTQDQTRDVLDSLTRHTHHLRASTPHPHTEHRHTG